MSTDPTFTDRLAATLDETAAAVDVRDGNPELVMALGRRRTARQRRGLAGLAAVALVTGAVGVLRLSDGGGEVRVDTRPAAERGSLNIEWEQVESASALGFARGFTNDRPIYALSTGPGERQRGNQPMSRVLWRSDDGVDWTAATSFGDDLYVSDLATVDGRVYAVGTAPAASRGRSGVDLVVGWSDDGGRRFDKQVLPVDWASIVRHLNPRVAHTSVASGEGGVVAVAAVSVDLDVPALLPDGASAPDGWATTDAGVDVLGPPRDDVCPEGSREAKGDDGRPRSSEIPPTWCEPESPDDQQKGQIRPIPPQEARGVVRSYSWDELGVTGDLRAAARRQFIAFHAPAGSGDFTRVELPETLNSWGDAAVESVGGGFQIAAVHGSDRYGSGAPEVALIRSVDGRTWTSDRSPVAAQWVSALGQLDGRTAMVTGSETGPYLSVSDGNGGWTTTPLADMVDPAVREGRMVGTGNAGIGPFGIAVSVTIHPEGDEYQERDIHQRLLVSRDGRTWDDLSVAELTGDPDAFVNRVTVGADEIVVAANYRPKEGPASTESRKPLVLVGRVR